MIVQYAYLVWLLVLQATAHTTMIAFGGFFNQSQPPVYDAQMVGISIR
jgi:hypothetical protein